MSEPARNADVLSLEAARAAKERTPSSSPLTPTTRGFTTRAAPLLLGTSLLRSLPIPLEAIVARSRDAGRPGYLAKPELAVWKIRVAVERGLVRPAPVDAAVLPEGLGAPTWRVWSGFVFLLGCKWLYEPAAPSVFSREFAAPWSGVSVRQASEAITTLKRMGYLIDTGGRHRRATLWLPRGAER